MQSNFSQFSQPGWLPQFPPQFQMGPGQPQFGPGPFAQTPFGVNPFAQLAGYGGNASFGHEIGTAGFGQQPYSMAGQPNPYGLGAQANPFVQNPFAQGPAHQLVPVSQQIVSVLGHLVQQIAVQNAVTQQIGVVLNQLAAQLAQTQQGTGFGAGPGFTGAGYGAFNPQAQVWNANRAQTIQ
jgi:hypothetical protein